MIDSFTIMDRMKSARLYRLVRYAFRMICENFRTKKWHSRRDLFVIQQITKLKALKDKHRGKPCVCIGNGPSVNAMDFAQFKDMVTIASNAFYLKHEQIGYVPTYYTVEDPLVAEDNKFEIMALKTTTKILPYEFKKIIRPDMNTIYVNFLRSYRRPSHPQWPTLSADFTNTVYWGGTVLYMNIQLAFHLGCNPIYLIGVDLSYKIPDSVKRAGSVLLSTENDNNHFDPRYFGKGKRWHLPETGRMQRAFTKAYVELKRANVELINAGIGGQLQIIPRSNIFHQALGGNE